MQGDAGRGQMKGQTTAPFHTQAYYSRTGSIDIINQQDQCDYPTEAGKRTTIRQVHKKKSLKWRYLPSPYTNYEG